MLQSPYEQLAWEKGETTILPQVNLFSLTLPRKGKISFGGRESAHFEEQDSNEGGVGDWRLVAIPTSKTALTAFEPQNFCAQARSACQFATDTGKPQELHGEETGNSWFDVRKSENREVNEKDKGFLVTKKNEMVKSEKV